MDQVCTILGSSKKCSQITVVKDSHNNPRPFSIYKLWKERDENVSVRFFFLFLFLGLSLVCICLGKSTTRTLVFHFEVWENTSWERLLSDFSCSETRFSPCTKI